MTDAQDGPVRAPRWGDRAVTPQKRRRESDLFPPSHPDLPCPDNWIWSAKEESQGSHMPPTANIGQIHPIGRK